MKKTLLLTILLLVGVAFALNQGAWQTGGLNQGAWQEESACVASYDTTYSDSGTVNSCFSGDSLRVDSIVTVTIDSIFCTDTAAAWLVLTDSVYALGADTALPTIDTVVVVCDSIQRTTSACTGLITALDTFATVTDSTIDTLANVRQISNNAIYASDTSAGAGSDSTLDSINVRSTSGDTTFISYFQRWTSRICSVHTDSTRDSMATDSISRVVRDCNSEVVSLDTFEITSFWADSSFTPSTICGAYFLDTLDYPDTPSSVDTLIASGDADKGIYLKQPVKKRIHKRKIYKKDPWWNGALPW